MEQSQMRKAALFYEIWKPNTISPSLKTVIDQGYKRHCAIEIKDAHDLQNPGMNCVSLMRPQVQHRRAFILRGR